MFTHIRRGLIMLVVLGWVTGCSDMGAPLRLVPRPELSAAALDFGTLAVGDSAAREVSVGNSGNAPLLAVAAVSCPDFRIRTGGGSFTVTPGGVHTLEIVYRASGVGAAACTLELGDGLPTVPLAGAGALQTPGDVGQVSLSGLDFGTLPVGQSALRTIRIRSTGTAPLRVDVAGTCTDFSLVAGAGPATIAPGDSLAVTVRYAPLTGGHHTCTLTTGPGLPEVALAGDATSVSFVADIRPIFINQGCFSCHGFISPSDVVNITSTLGYAPAVLVIPFDPDNSVLYNKVANTRVYGGAMPQGTAGLPAAQRDKIRNWILEGALDN